MATPDLGFAILNPATGQASLYPNAPARLELTLTNATGADIGLQTGGQASTLEIYLPAFCAAAELAHTSIALTNWTFAYSATDQSLMLTYTGPAGAVWANDTSLFFAIANVVAKGDPAAGMVQVNPAGMTGSVPLQVQQPLNLVKQPQPGHAHLADVLQVSLDNAGTVFVSAAGDPLVNTLTLNLKNRGQTPLYAGAAPWTSNPRVLVTFVNGLTAGSLAPDSDRTAPQTGSAWNIAASIPVSEGNAWQAQNPSPTGSAKHPVWELNPTPANLGIIGVGDGANITFAFQDIVSFTPVGHTQMTVQFSGFSQDEHTPYDDWVVVLDIVKTVAQGRGAAKPVSPTPTITVTTPGAPVTFPLGWSMSNVDSATLTWNLGAEVLHSANYRTSGGWPPAVNHDQASPRLAYSEIVQRLHSIAAQTVTFTLDTYDGNGNLINSPQFEFSVNSVPGILTFTAGAAAPTSSQPFPGLSFPISWTLFETTRITLSWSAGGSAPHLLVDRTYTPVLLSQTDSFTAQLAYSDIATADRLVFTLTAYDANGNVFNSRPVTGFFFIDPRDGQFYPVVVIAGHVWTAQNLRWQSPGNTSFIYNDNPDPAFLAQYGRLYLREGALQSVPPGWRLPTPDDWHDLLFAFAGNQPAYRRDHRFDWLPVWVDVYQKLIAGGSSGFNAQLGGLTPFDPHEVRYVYDPNLHRYVVHRRFKDVGMGEDGIYWMGPDCTSCIQFETWSNGFIEPIRENRNSWAMSVRYVKDV